MMKMKNSSNSNEVEEVEEGNWKIIHIPDKPPLPPHLHPTVNVYASVIDDPKYANTLVRRLNKIAPLENLRHVKRVRRQCLEGGKTQLSVILCLACRDDSQLDAVPNDVLELINADQLSTFITKVSKYPASSKEEWEEQSKLWPTSYHPPTYNIDGITGFSVEDSRSVFNFMKAAVDLAKSGDGQLVNAAVIVNPSTKQAIASACDEVLSWNRNTAINKRSEEETNCSEQLLEASTNSIVDQVKTHRNSVSNCSTQGVSCLHPWWWAEQQLGTSSSFWHPLRHAAIVAIEHSATRDRLLFPASVQNREKLMPEVCVQSPSTGPPSKRQKSNLTNVEDDGEQNCHSNGCNSESGRPYLCTGYDIYLVWEPCTMCAMALVHQRIKRIFYAFPNPSAGALGSAHRLQGEKSLNHHYAVFRVLLPQEALDEGGQTVIGASAENNRTETHVC